MKKKERMLPWKRTLIWTTMFAQCSFYTMGTLVMGFIFWKLFLWSNWLWLFYHLIKE